MITEPAVSITVPQYLPVTRCPHQPDSKLNDQQCLMCPATGSVNGPGDLGDPPGSKPWPVRKAGWGAHV